MVAGVVEAFDVGAEAGGALLATADSVDPGPDEGGTVPVADASAPAGAGEDGGPVSMGCDDSAPTPVAAAAAALGHRCASCRDGGPARGRH